jgi:hypothetical protein
MLTEKHKSKDTFDKNTLMRKESRGPRDQESDPDLEYVVGQRISERNVLMKEISSRWFWVDHADAMAQAVQSG